MKTFAAIIGLTALSVLPAPAEAQNRNRDRDRGLVVQVQPRSYLDAGTNVQPGQYQNYSLGLTPHRAFDSIVQTGSAEQRLLPGRHGIMWQ